MKSRLFWPAIAAVAIGVAAPFIAFLQLSAAVPRYTHGGFMAALLAVHVAVWARTLFLLQLMDGLLAVPVSAEIDVEEVRP